MDKKYVPAEFMGDAFHCPHCEAFAHQNWNQVSTRMLGIMNAEYLSVSICTRCKGMSIWFQKKMVYPVLSIAPMPSENMPDDVRLDFIEAREIINNSPRAACALLRLSIQKLMIHLGEKGKNLNDDIGNLVKKGLSAKIQRALDSVRVIGNNAIHPGELDLKDDVETAAYLFELVNMIVEVMISQPQKVDMLFEKIPGEAKEAIEKRDKSGKVE